MIILQGERERIDFLAFSPNGRLLARIDQGLQLWDDVTAKAAPLTLPLPYVGRVRFTPDGQKLLLGRGSQNTVVLDLGTAAQTSIPLELNRAYPLFDFTPDGRAVVFVQPDTRPQPSRLYRRRLSDLPISEWSIDSPRYAFTPPLFLADGKRFVVFEAWSEMNPFRYGVRYVTRDVTTGGTLAEVVRESSDRFEDPVQSADRRLIAARLGNRIAAFLAEDFSISPVIIRNDSRKQFTGHAFHPSGRFLAATSNDATVKLYDTATWRLAHAFAWEIGRLRSIAFSPDGMLAAAGGDKGKVVVWDFDL